MMQKYAIRGAESRDIEAIMRVEHQSFAAGIAETQAVFAERLACAARCNYVLLDSGAQSVCGYVTAEIWEMAPFDPALFSLGHSVREQHRPDGTTLYISSFALLPEVRGIRIPRSALSIESRASKAGADTAKGEPTIGLAALFFTTVLERIGAAFPQLERIVLLVHEEWHNALALYEKYGFTPIQTLDRFAWFGGKRAFVYEKMISNKPL